MMTVTAVMTMTNITTTITNQQREEEKDIKRIQID